MCLPDILCTRVSSQSPECTARAEDTTWGECAVYLFIYLFGGPLSGSRLEREQNKWSDAVYGERAALTRRDATRRDTLKLTEFDARAGLAASVLPIKVRGCSFSYVSYVMHPDISIQLRHESPCNMSRVEGGTTRCRSDFACSFSL